MRRRVLLAVLPGLLVGLAICATSEILFRTSDATRRGDVLMGNQLLLAYGSRPLSLITADAAYRLKSRYDSSMVWTSVEFGQVIINWILISTLVAVVVFRIRRS